MAALFPAMQSPALGESTPFLLMAVWCCLAVGQKGKPSPEHTAWLPLIHFAMLFSLLTATYLPVPDAPYGTNSHLPLSG